MNLRVAHRTRARAGHAMNAAMLRISGLAQLTSAVDAASLLRAADDARWRKYDTPSCDRLLARSKCLVIFELELQFSEPSS